MFVKEVVWNVFYDVSSIIEFFRNIRSLMNDHKTFNGWSPPDVFPKRGDFGPYCTACEDNKSVSLTRFVRIEADGTWLYNCESCLKDRRW